MRKIAALPALLAACVLAAVAGCGGQHSSSSGADSDSGALAAAHARCVWLKPEPALPGPGARLAVTITQQDNGKAICVHAGIGIFVVLHGSTGRMWSSIRPTSAILQPRASGVMTLARGVTGGSFQAVRPGSTALTSVLPPCPVATDGSTPAAGTPHCAASSIFRVTVLVRSRS